ncbi:hypothetical protein LMG7974_00380 [Campylobacter majalis]|uniref:NAD(P)-binding domain-containing protein n=1 Tax=Campylobacter majalis TaxID=2790656 RepID=A0ABN7K7A7_9BACT|nr:NAD(P)-dependent oxidoreductase [Campylobacter majalis]CAD7287501.1 hypothetical protein LMG7974_00380 [Campylobacter majalis]
MSKNIAILGANGCAGSKILSEAKERGYSVKAIVRNRDYIGKNVLYKSVLELTKDDLSGVDVVISALGFWQDDDRHLHTKALIHLADLLSGTQTRLMVVGGAGSLYVDDSMSVKLLDTPDFPNEYKPTANAMSQALDALRKRDDVRWTFLSPAAEFEPDLARTGEYILANEIFTLNDKGESVIGYADYAVAMIDEIENENFIQKRFSVVGK